jgi:hypothetical protein
MNIQDFADQFRLRITRDECNDKIISGKRGHLYFAGGKLCLMVIDGAPAIRRHWEALGGRLWMGDISLSAKGQRVQDVKIEDIPIENAATAIKMVRARQKRVLSSEERQARLVRFRRNDDSPNTRLSPALETLAEVDPVGN